MPIIDRLLSREPTRGRDSPGEAFGYSESHVKAGLLVQKVIYFSDPLRKASIVLSKAFLCDGGSSSIFSILRMSLKLGLV